MAATLPGSLRDKTLFLHRAGWIGTGRALDFFAMYLRFNKPHQLARWQRVRDVVMSPRRIVNAVRRRLGAMRN